MFKIGNRVAPFFNMGKKGTIVEMREVNHQTWMVDGSAGHACAFSIETSISINLGSILLGFLRLQSFIAFSLISSYEIGSDSAC